MKSTSILSVSSSYPRFPGDPSGCFVKELNMQLSRYATIQSVVPDFPKNTVHDATVDYFQYFWPRSFQKLTYGSGTIQNLKTNPLLAFQVPFYYHSLKKNIQKNLKKELIILVHWLFPNALAAITALKRSGIPIIGVAHGGDLRILRKIPLRRSFLSCLSNHLEQIIFVSKNLRDVYIEISERALRNQIESKSRVIPMGCYTGISRIRSIRPDRPVTVVFSGRMIPEKGIDELLGAIRGLPWIRLNLVGDGPERKKLERKSSQFIDRVHFLGWLDRDQYSKTLLESDIAVFPFKNTSKTGEGSPGVIKDALSSGLVVITTGAGGVSELIVNGYNGIMMDYPDPLKIRKVLEEVRDDPVRAAWISANAVETAQQYDWQRIGERYWEAIRSVSNSR